MATHHHLLTYQDYLELPKAFNRYEVLDGKLVPMTPGPTPEHQRILLRMAVRLDQFISRHNLGEIFIAPLDIIVSRDPLRTRQPDLMYISRERASIVRDRIEGGPDLVVEILSPGNTRQTIERKIDDYRKLLIRECWVVSARARRIEQLQLMGSGFEPPVHFGASGVLTTPVLPGFELQIGQIFADSPPERE